MEMIRQEPNVQLLKFKHLGMVLRQGLANINITIRITNIHIIVITTVLMGHAKLPDLTVVATS